MPPATCAGSLHSKSLGSAVPSSATQTSARLVPRLPAAPAVQCSTAASAMSAASSGDKHVGLSRLQLRSAAAGACSCKAAPCLQHLNLYTQRFCFCGTDDVACHQRYPHALRQC